MAQLNRLNKLNKTESGQVMRIMQTEGWGALMKLVTLTIMELNGRECAGSNAFEVLRYLHIREGQVKGLREFFDGLERGESLSDEATRGQLQ